MKQILSILIVLVAVPFVPVSDEPVQADPPAVVSATPQKSPEVTAKPAEEFKAAVEELAPKAEPQPTLAISTYTHRVRARGHVLAIVNGVRQWIVPENPPRATAVSLGGGRFVTAGHLMDGLGGKIEVDVEVDGKWVNNARRTKVQGRDLLVLTIDDKTVDGIETRKPEHFEEVTLLGLETGKPQSGIYASEEHVALRPGQPGVIPGDSGGGIFGPDGKLLGIVQGYSNGGNLSVVMVSVEDLPSDAPAVSAPAQPSPGPVQSCPGGVCPAPQVQFSQPRGVFRGWRKR